MVQERHRKRESDKDGISVCMWNSIWDPFTRKPFEPVKRSELNRFYLFRYPLPLDKLIIANDIRPFSIQHLWWAFKCVFILINTFCLVQVLNWMILLFFLCPPFLFHWKSQYRHIHVLFQTILMIKCSWDNNEIRKTWNQN